MDRALIRIRRAEASDAAAIARSFDGASVIAGTLQQPYPDEARWSERLAGNGPLDHVLVAEVDGQLVGTAGLHGNANPRRAHAAALGISVQDAWQGKGVGRALLTALIDIADNWLGLLRLELTVFDDNLAAIALYESTGFVHEGRCRAYALRNGRFVDSLTMARLHPQPPAMQAQAPA